MDKTEIITIKVNGIKVDLEFTFNEYEWKVYCNKDQEIDFYGNVWNGHYSYNKKNVVMFLDAKEFYFFGDTVRNKMLVILKRNKIINK